MRARKLLQACLITLIAPGCELVTSAQVRDRDMNSMPAASETASISGRVVLPSGRSLDSNVKIVLSNTQSPLDTLYTDKHGEFRFMNMREGIYYIEVVGDSKFYEPVSKEVPVPRGANVNVTIFLQEKTVMSFKRPGTALVSAVDFNQRAPDQARKEYERASQLIGKGDFLKAIEHLKQAIDIYPDYLMARNDLGVQYLKLKQLEPAAEQFELILEREPKDFGSRLNLGLVLMEQKRY